MSHPIEFIRMINFLKYLEDIENGNQKGHNTTSLVRGNKENQLLHQDIKKKETQEENFILKNLDFMHIYNKRYPKRNELKK